MKRLCENEMANCNDSERISILSNATSEHQRSSILNSPPRRLWPWNTFLVSKITGREKILEAAFGSGRYKRQDVRGTPRTTMSSRILSDPHPGKYVEKDEQGKA
jgi:hypothetical protein